MCVCEREREREREIVSVCVREFGGISVSGVEVRMTGKAGTLPLFPHTTACLSMHTHRWHCLSMHTHTGYVTETERQRQDR